MREAMALARRLGLSAETRSFAVRDWARWSEKHGQPWIELQVPASKAESDESEEFFQQMREIGQESVIVSPQGDGETRLTYPFRFSNGARTSAP